MNLSGILVVTQPTNLDALVALLDQQPGIEVHHTDPSSGRIILVQEAESVDEEVAGLKRLKRLPGIVLAELVYHYFGEGQPQHSDPDPGELDPLTGLNSPEVVDYLNS